MKDDNFITKSFLTQKIRTLIPKNSYRFMAYLATVFTGFTALCSQVIWQRHMAILTGSEARSMSLVIAVFLFGLAGGYYVFGLFTEKNKISRFLLLKYYGYVELLTGFYIGLFPVYFHFLKKLSFQAPNLLIIDILITLMALFLPTFFMGASIPLLTTALPENSKEVSSIHAKVYGWNSLGACFGALASGFYLIPALGLNLSLSLAGIINVFVSLIFIGNSLEGSIQKQDDILSIPSPLSNSFFMFFTFLTGALIISFEILFIRILNLSLGAGVYNFPIILSLFVGGLSLGSLSIKKKKISMNFFTIQLLITLFLLQILFYTAPYWSIWFSNIRVSLAVLPSNYFVYYFVIFLFLIVFLFPAVFFMGRLLPLSYTFLKKTKDNYGKVCGQLYFFNTLGTVFGAVFIGYLAFYLFNLDILFKMNIYILFLLTLAVLVYTKVKIHFIILSVLGLILLLLPTQWDRSGHEVGYFRIKTYKKNIHFKELFFLPKHRKKNSRISFFKDGPNTTVSLLTHSFHSANTALLPHLKELFQSDHFKKDFSYSIVVNGKSDGNLLGDFSTMFFMIPYFYAPDKSDLETAFIGLGTGISPGSYIALDDVKGIDVLEISPFVIKAIQSVNPELNFHVMQNKKVKIKETDAFRHFTRSKKTYDIIISEPSNPWVIGVENLFTKEFYQLVSQSLNKGGIFGQWIYTYDMDIETIEIVIKTIHQVFPYASLYYIGYSDLLILASKEEFKELSEERFNKPFVKKFYRAMGFKKVEDIYLTQIFNPREFNFIAKWINISPKKVIQKKSWFKRKPYTSEEFLMFNSVLRPQLIYRTNKSMFLGQKADPFFLKNKFQPEGQKETEKMKSFNEYKNTTVEEWNNRCLPHAGFNFLCFLMKNSINRWSSLNNEGEPYFVKLQNYFFLRNQGLISYNAKIMGDFLNHSMKQKNLNILAKYVDEKMKIKDYKGANEDALVFKNKQLINTDHYNNFKRDLERVRKAHSFLEGEGAL